jgi:hypothetical protein
VWGQPLHHPALLGLNPLLFGADLFVCRIVNLILDGP